MPTNNAINNITPTGFQAYLSATAVDVTGNGDPYVVVCDTTIINDGNYNTATGLYTVPHNGRYLITGSVAFINIGILHTNALLVGRVDGATTFIGFDVNPYTLQANIDQECALTFNANLYMTATQTLDLVFIVAGSTKTIDVFGGTTPYATYLSVSKII